MRVMVYGRKTKTSELAERYIEELGKKHLKKDTPVMSVRALAMHYSISLVTAQRVLDLLEERGVIYRVPHKGSFIKNDAEHKPVIAYAGTLPDPLALDVIKRDAQEKLFGHFAELGIEPRLIPYHILNEAEKARQLLEGTEGLLLESSFLDKKTSDLLWNYSGCIVMVGNTYCQERLSCSQVIPDYTAALRDFHSRFDFNNYSSIMIVGAKHGNAIADARSVALILEGLGVDARRIKTQLISVYSSANAFQVTYRHFHKMDKAAFDGILIISLSDYISQGMEAAFGDREHMPDILGIDNLEAYCGTSGKEPYFTSIDRRHGKIWCKALDLLVKELKNGGECTEILRIPSRLVVRRSVRLNDKTKAD